MALERTKIATLSMLACLMIATPPARAATAEIVYTETGQGSSYSYGLDPYYRAAAGESNQLTITAGVDGSARSFVLFTDTGAAIEPGDGCFALDAHRVRCEDDENGVGIGDPTAVLGDGDDSAQTDTVATLDGGSGDDVLVGSSGRDIIFGLEGADVIRSGPRADVVDGGLDTDDIAAGLGDDRLGDAGGSGDTIDGGPGKDLLDLSRRRRSVTIELVAGLSGELGENDAILNIENANGGRGDDVLMGDAGPNRLFGAAGADRLVGGRGHDRLTGGRGADALLARDGQRDVVWGGPQPGGGDRARVDRDLDWLANIGRLF